MQDTPTGQNTDENSAGKEASTIDNHASDKNRDNNILNRGENKSNNRDSGIDFHDELASPRHGSSIDVPRKLQDSDSDGDIYLGTTFSGMFQTIEEASHSPSPASQAAKSPHAGSY